MLAGSALSPMHDSRTNYFFCENSVHELHTHNWFQYWRHCSSAKLPAVPGVASAGNLSFCGLLKLVIEAFREPARWTIDATREVH